MAGFTWGARDPDAEFFERELTGFLPDRIFDAHVHLVRFADCSDTVRAPWEGICPAELSLAEYRAQIRAVHGEAHTDALCVGIVPNDNPGVPNEYVASEVKDLPNCAAHFLVRPDDDPEWGRGEVRRLGMCGLEPFHSFVREPVSATTECEIPKYLPAPIPTRRRFRSRRRSGSSPAIASSRAPTSGGATSAAPARTRATASSGSTKPTATLTRTSAPTAPPFAGSNTFAPSNGRRGASACRTGTSRTILAQTPGGCSD